MKFNDAIKKKYNNFAIISNFANHNFFSSEK